MIVIEKDGTTTEIEIAATGKTTTRQYVTPVFVLPRGEKPTKDRIAPANGDRTIEYDDVHGNHHTIVIDEKDQAKETVIDPKTRKTISERDYTVAFDPKGNRIETETSKTGDTATEQIFAPSGNRIKSTESTTTGDGQGNPRRTTVTTKTYPDAKAAPPDEEVVITRKFELNEDFQSALVEVIKVKIIYNPNPRYIQQKIVQRVRYNAAGYASGEETKTTYQNPQDKTGTTTTNPNFHPNDNLNPEDWP
ncbi:MAG: hypothetical protein JOZ57_12685 [Abitibacteriaceae bacterium]|nr:hypothetical protein [Abditibacteriaceae bacterium]